MTLAVLSSSLLLYNRVVLLRIIGLSFVLTSMQGMRQRRPDRIHSMVARAQ